MKMMERKRCGAEISDNRSKVSIEFLDSLRQTDKALLRSVCSKVSTRNFTSCVAVNQMRMNQKSQPKENQPDERDESEALKVLVFESSFSSKIRSIDTLLLDL